MGVGNFFLFRYLVMNGFGKKKEILIFDIWNKFNVINRMLIWFLCVKGFLFILYYNRNGGKIEIVSLVYDDLNNFWMDKVFDNMIIIMLKFEDIIFKNKFWCCVC